MAIECAPPHRDTNTHSFKKNTPHTRLPIFALKPLNRITNVFKESTLHGDCVDCAIFVAFIMLKIPLSTHGIRK